MNHINDNNQISSTYTILDKISSYLPEINNVFKTINKYYYIT